MTATGRKRIMKEILKNIRKEETEAGKTRGLNCSQNGELNWKIEV